MALKKASRGAQWPLVAEFPFAFNDTIVPIIGGNAVDFGLTNILSTAIEIIPLPPGAVVIAGSVDTLEIFDAATFNVIIGDSSNASRYLASTDRKGLGTTPLVVTGFQGTGQNIRMVFQAADVCTSGKAVVRVTYVIAGRVCEVQTN